MSTKRLATTAMMMCIIIISIFLLRVPIPFTQGYVNLSDGMIFLAVLILGWKYGGAAAALGSMLGDIVGGFAMWAPWTFFIKGIMAIIVGLILDAAMNGQGVTQRKMNVWKVLAMCAGGLFMTGGYFIAEGIMYGNWVIAALGIPWNAGQFVLGIVIAMALGAALNKTGFRTFMAQYNVKLGE